MFSPVTTPETMQAYPVWKNTIRQGKEGYIGEEERQLRSEVGAFIVAAAAVAPAGTPEVFTKLLQFKRIKLNYRGKISTAPYLDFRG